MSGNKFPLVPVIVIAVILLGATVFVVTNSVNNTPAQPKPTAQQENPIEFQTFSVDELNQPLDASNAEAALSRNEARVDYTLEQLEQDEATITELQELFQ